MLDFVDPVLCRANRIEQHMGEKFYFVARVDRETGDVEVLSKADKDQSKILTFRDMLLVRDGTFVCETTYA